MGPENKHLEESRITTSTLGCKVNGLSDFFFLFHPYIQRYKTVEREHMCPYLSGHYVAFWHSYLGDNFDFERVD